MLWPLLNVLMLNLLMILKLILKTRKTIIDYFNTQGYFQNAIFTISSEKSDFVIYLFLS